MYGFAGRAVLSFFIMCFSRVFSGILPIVFLSLALAMSLAVSGAEQKYSGNLLHTI